MTAPWPIVDPKDEGIRPAGLSDHCFYCEQPVGQPHAQDCVVVTKTVRLRYIFTVDVKVPHCWDEDTILFHRNKSSWCATNGLLEMGLAEMSDVCLCPIFTAEYVETVDDTPQRELQP